MGTVGGKARRWLTIRCAKTYEKRLSTLFLDVLKPGKFQITVKNAADGRCLSGYVSFRPYPVRERWLWAYSIFCVRPLRVCSFDSDGQFQGLRTWDEQPISALTLFLFINQSNANKGAGRHI